MKKKQVMRQLDNIVKNYTVTQDFKKSLDEIGNDLEAIKGGYIIVLMKDGRVAEYSHNLEYGEKLRLLETARDTITVNLTIQTLKERGYTND